MARLNNTKIQQELKHLTGWTKRRIEIRKKFKFKDFVRAMGFVNSVALLAERANHHPDVDIRWNKVLLVLSTHSEGGITRKDIALAKEIQSLLK
ncbi:MAG: 4a-hydroxytetrahydrobiopterin dehydratase [Bacteroidota bacterium]